MTIRKPDYPIKTSATLPRSIAAPFARFHRDECGTISIVSVFALILLAMLLGMVLNVGFQADNKVRMQNAADASAYSGGIVLARGMNTLAFTNHLLFDVFALTAFLREGRDNHGAPMVPEILAAWDETAPLFDSDEFETFGNWNGRYTGVQFSFGPSQLSSSIQAKVPIEQEMVRSFSAWAAAFSNQILPTLEQILDDELIPEYQRALVVTVPEIAQIATNEVAQGHGFNRDGEIHPRRGPLQGMMWTSRVEPIGGRTEYSYRSLPVVDPVQDAMPEQDYYLDVARQQRAELAKRYLDHWNQEKLAPFRYVGRMSQFYELWIGFTCGQLKKLLEENELRNLPHIIRTPPEVIEVALAEVAQGRSITSTTVDEVMKFEAAQDRNDFLEEHYMYMAALYWPEVSHALPGLFRNPFDGDHVTYAQVMMFIPRNRLFRGRRCYKVYCGQQGVIRYACHSGDRGQHPTRWDLLNQSWRVQLVAATNPNLLAILQTSPEFDGEHGQPSQDVNLPEFGQLTAEDLALISHH